MSEYVNNDCSPRKINQRRENSPNNCVLTARELILVYRWVLNGVEFRGVASSLANFTKG